LRSPRREKEEPLAFAQMPVDRWALAALRGIANVVAHAFEE
jgi:hypothetical protein